MYFVATNKQGISSTELSRKLGLRQKTCQSFKRKVMIAMASCQDYPLKGKVGVDETVVGQQEEVLRGRKNDKKKFVVVAIERKEEALGVCMGVKSTMQATNLSSPSLKITLHQKYRLKLANGQDTYH